MLFHFSILVQLIYLAYLSSRQGTGQRVGIAFWVPFGLGLLLLGWTAEMGRFFALSADKETPSDLERVHAHAAEYGTVFGCVVVSEGRLPYVCNVHGSPDPVARALQCSVDGCIAVKP